MDSPVFGRFVIVMDGNNLYHTLRELGFHLDYGKLLTHFGAGGTLIRAHYFTALLDAPLTPDWLIRLTDWLAYNRYTVHIKRARVFVRPMTDDDGEKSTVREIKGNVEIEMVVEALAAAPYCDTLIIFSGSGELVSLVKAVQGCGCRVVVVSSQQTPDSSIAGDLRRQADDFIDLETLRPYVEMDPVPVTPRLLSLAMRRSGESVHFRQRRRNE